MQLGMVGLGRMGANLVRRLMRAGHECVVYDVNAGRGRRSSWPRARPAAKTLDEFVAALTPPRAAWVMVPAAFAGETVTDLAGRMAPGDIVIDGGNTYYRDDVDRAAELTESGIHYVDIGTSGGVFGLERGFCLMIGGETEIVAHLDPILATIAPGVDAAPRTEGRTGTPSTAEQGYLHCGPAGAGHFVKMVHNGIEYGMMAAYAEGLNVLQHADVGTSTRDHDAETTPLRDPQYYQYELDLPEVAEVWRRGQRDRVVAARPHRARALGVADARRVRGPRVGLGRGALDRARRDRRGRADPRAVGRAVRPLRVARASPSSPNRLLSAMRKEFGGHDEKS